MKKITMTNKLLKSIVADLNNKIINNHISNVTLLNSSDLIMTFSFYRSKKLFISINHSRPLIGLIDKKESFQTLDDELSRVLRKDIRDSYILKIEQLNDDKIVKFTLSALSKDLSRVIIYLILELIPKKPNLIICDSEERIKFATHYEGEDKDRKITKGSPYILPANNFVENYSEDINVDDFYYELDNDFLNVEKKRIDEKFADLFSLIKGRKKHLERKIKILTDEQSSAKSKLIYKDAGNIILTLEDLDAKNELDNMGIVWDSNLSKIDNANHYFSIYKKAKNQIEKGKEQLDLSLEELSYLNHIEEQLQFANEDDAKEIRNQLIKSEPNKKKKIQNKPKVKSVHFVSNNETKIFYGKSDTQNDELTFKIANFKHTFLHIHGIPGSHVIIASDNVAKDDLLLGTEIALILSNRQDGDVDYTLVKNVKKGGKPGLVILKEYKTIHLNKIRESTVELITKN